MNRVFVTLAILFLCTELLAQSNTMALTQADQMPYFSGCTNMEYGSNEKRSCSNNALITFISNHLVYPSEAKENQIEGTVYVSFVVDKNGAITDGEVLHDIGSGCGDAALKVLKQMPSWEPGLSGEKPVAVKLNLPIRFSLKSATNSNASKYKLAWGQIRGNKITKDQIKSNLETEIFVRDQFGNTLPISNLTFSYEKRKYYVDAESKGYINEKQKKLAKKSKVGGILIVSATIQDSGNMIDIDREFEIVK